MCPIFAFHSLVNTQVGQNRAGKVSWKNYDVGHNRSLTVHVEEVVRRIVECVELVDGAVLDLKLVLRDDRALDHRKFLKKTIFVSLLG